MNIYVSHSTQFDYQNELYAPLRNFAMHAKHTFIFPHDTETLVNSKEYIRNADLVLAEVSHPSTGVGIELGWADSYQVPIIFLHRTGAILSGSLSAVSTKFLSYSSPEDLSGILAHAIPA